MRLSEFHLLIVKTLDRYTVAYKKSLLRYLSYDSKLPVILPNLKQSLCELGLAQSLLITKKLLINNTNVIKAYDSIRSKIKERVVFYSCKFLTYDRKLDNIFHLHNILFN